MVFLRKAHVKVLAVLVLISSIGVGGCGNRNGSYAFNRMMVLEAEQGDPHAQFYLGEYYLAKRKDRVENCDIAMQYLKQAASQSHDLAQNRLGDEYLEGQNCVKQDYKRAMFWYQKAADQGLAKSKMRIAEMYEKGQGVVQNMEKAAKWHKEADEGDSRIIVLIGSGVKK